MKYLTFDKIKNKSYNNERTYFHDNYPGITHWGEEGGIPENHIWFFSDRNLLRLLRYINTAENIEPDQLGSDYSIEIPALMEVYRRHLVNAAEDYIHSGPIDFHTIAADNNYEI